MLVCSSWPLLPICATPGTFSVVKRAIVGSGRAEKAQVAQLVGALLGLKELPGIDATDALAIALTHLNVCRIGV